MSNRARPMPDYFVRSIIVAELRRAEREGVHPDRHYLRRETGIPWHRLDARVAAVRRELKSAADCNPASVGGAKAGPGPSPKETDPDPFAPPIRGQTERQNQWTRNSKA